MQATRSRRRLVWEGALTMSALAFEHLNLDWNAEPNAPQPVVMVSGADVRVAFYLNPWAYLADEGERGRLIFKDCTRWRLGETNDEGWYRGQCRYSKIAPGWGEFYELTGSDDQQPWPTDWQELAASASRQRHFLFYFRDETFECFAATWSFESTAESAPPRVGALGRILERICSIGRIRWRKSV